MFVKMRKTNGEPYTGRLVRTVRGQVPGNLPSQGGKALGAEPTIFDFLNCKKPFDRLWISSLTDKAIREGLQKLKNGTEYDNLYQSGKARSEADWLVGINASRALSISAQKGGYSLGRVQTPTLAMISKRFLENKNFQSVPYWQIKLTVEKSGIRLKAVSEAKFDNDATARSVLKTNFEDKTGSLAVSKVERKAVDTEPPLLFDLTNLQKEVNRKHGFSADKTLSIAQSLYEKKLITYPRTGSRYIGEDIFEEIPSLVENLQNHPIFGKYALFLSNKTLNKRCVNASKVTDHHALLITENTPNGLSQDEQTIYNSIAGRMLEAFSEKSSQEVQTVEFFAGEYRFKMKNSRLLESGWRSVLNEKPQTDEDADELEQNILPDFSEGETVPVTSHEITQHQTKPKPLYTEASLLSAMETAGKDIADETAKAAIKDCGLGTPATRAGIIETLILREYIVREKKNLVPTEKGLAVFEIVKDRKIADAEMTGNWEKALADIEAGKMNAETFHKGIEIYAGQICKELLATSVSVNRTPTLACPKCQSESLMLYPKVAKCKKCDFLVFRELCGLMLSDEQIKALVTEKKTPLLKGLTAKSGKKFNARLVLNPDHTTSFAFDPKPNRK
jgi:DNA topoisomerase-3